LQAILTAVGFTDNFHLLAIFQQTSNPGYYQLVVVG